jgi:hypothetical protein
MASSTGASRMPSTAEFGAFEDAGIGHRGIVSAVRCDRHLQDPWRSRQGVFHSRRAFRVRCPLSRLCSPFLWRGGCANVGVAGLIDRVSPDAHLTGAYRVCILGNYGGS